MLFRKDSPQNNNEVASFEKLPVIRKFYCHCLESTRLTSSCDNNEKVLLKLNPNLETTSRNKEVFNSFKDDNGGLRIFSRALTTKQRDRS